MSSISSNGFSAAQAFGSHRGHHAHAPIAEQKQAFNNALKQVGLDDQAAQNVQDQIDAAIKQNGKSGGRDAIRKTIDDILTKNGVDTQKFQQALRSEFQKLRGAQGQGAEGSFAGARRQGDGDGDSDDGGGSSKLGAINTIA